MNRSGWSALAFFLVVAVECLGDFTWLKVADRQRGRPWRRRVARTRRSRSATSEIDAAAPNETGRYPSGFP